MLDFLGSTLFVWLIFNILYMEDECETPIIWLNTIKRKMEILKIIWECLRILKKVENI
jgi:hypothetical protein